MVTHDLQTLFFLVIFTRLNSLARQPVSWSVAFTNTRHLKGSATIQQAAIDREYGNDIASRQFHDLNSMKSPYSKNLVAICDQIPVKASHMDGTPFPNKTANSI